MEETDNDGNRDAKRLKSMQVDLKVIVGSDENGGIEEFWHYRSNLAYESGFVDTLLSTRVGVHNGTIAFPDVTPKQWRLMMQILRKPHLLQKSSVDTVCELAVLYDKYDFEMGLDICDNFLEKVIPQHVRCYEELQDFNKLDEWIDIIALSHQANLKKTLDRGKTWLRCRVLRDTLAPEFEVVGYDLFLSNAHFEKLAPVLKTMENEITQMLNYPDVDIDVTSPLFPLLVRHEVAEIARKARREVRKVHVSFSYEDHEAAGEYIHVARATDDIVRSPRETIIRYRLYKKKRWTQFELRRHPVEGCWELWKDEGALFRCNTAYEQFYHVPPEDGEWIDLRRDIFAEGLPPYLPTIDH